MKTSFKLEHSPTVIDLYAGVGGLSLGAARAGFDVRLAVELDDIIAETHALNFPNTRHLQKDVSKLSGEDLLVNAGLNPGELVGLIGGPPCQGFSAIGKSDPNDPRNALFGHFFRLVAETQPMFFLAENVPGILAERNSSVISAAMDLVPARYKLHKIVIKASDYGAPTSRKRVFFIGIDSDKVSPKFSMEDIVAPYESAVNVGHALHGLPSIRSSWSTEGESWRSRLEIPTDGFFDRVSNARPVGVGDPHSIYRHDVLNKISGCFGTQHDPETVRRFSLLQPGEVDSVSRAKKLHPKGFCPTLRAGTSSDRGSFQAVRPIHPGSPRVITPREAARLQGFPDWFIFHPTKWHSFRQIGNSVSPIVAESLLVAIRSRL